MIGVVSIASHGKLPSPPNLMTCIACIPSFSGRCKPIFNNTQLANLNLTLHSSTASKLTWKPKNDVFHHNSPLPRGSPFSGSIILLFGGSSYPKQGRAVKTLQRCCVPQRRLQHRPRAAGVPIPT